MKRLVIVCVLGWCCWKKDENSPVKEVWFDPPPTPTNRAEGGKTHTTTRHLSFFSSFTLLAMVCACLDIISACVGMLVTAYSGVDSGRAVEGNTGKEEVWLIKARSYTLTSCSLLGQRSKFKRRTTEPTFSLINTESLNPYISRQKKEILTLADHNMFG